MPEKPALSPLMKLFIVAAFVAVVINTMYLALPFGMNMISEGSALSWLLLVLVFIVPAHFIMMGLVKGYTVWDRFNTRWQEGHNERLASANTSLEAEIEEFKRTHPRFNRILRAMRRVNVNLYRTPIALKDIGLLLYETADEQNPTIWRDGSVPFSSHYLRPFADIEYWHGKKSKPFEVTLEICDQRSAPLLIDTSTEKWAGRLTIPVLSSTWLDLTKTSAEKEKQWSVRVRINGKYLALHPFTWSQIDEALITTRKDGEISQELSHLLEKEKHLTSVSLDELLAESES